MVINKKNIESDFIFCFFKMSRPKIRLQINIKFKRHIDARN
jgi:hypothetical protein